MASMGSSGKEYLMSPEAAAYFSNAMTDLAPADKAASRIASRPEDKTQDQSIIVAEVARGGSDEDLMMQIREGSKEALALLFRRHSSSVMNVGRRILRDNAEAEDLLQEIFLFVFQRARLFDPSRGTAISWIVQVTYHRAMNRRKYLNVRQHYGALEFDEELQGQVAAPATIDELASRELLNKFRLELTADQRQILELHFFEGYTFHEIAAKTGQTFGSVRNHYYRGLERLRSFVFPKETR